MERYIAVDNVCAWPNLTVMPDGAIIATIFNQPTHGGWEGEVECWASEDMGRTWPLRGVPAPHDPGTNRMNVAAGLARDGSLVVLVSGWDSRPSAGEHPGFGDAECLPILVCRSGDGGRTWQTAESIMVPEKGSERIIPFGDICSLADGTLGVCIYRGGPTVEGNTSDFYRSSDDGRSWEPRGVIGEKDYNETTPVVLADGGYPSTVQTDDGTLVTAYYSNGIHSHHRYHMGVLRWNLEGRE